MIKKGGTMDFDSETRIEKQLLVQNKNDINLNQQVNRQRIDREEFEIYSHVNPKTINIMKNYGRRHESTRKGNLIRYAKKNNILDENNQQITNLSVLKKVVMEGTGITWNARQHLETMIAVRDAEKRLIQTRDHEFLTHYTSSSGSIRKKGIKLISSSKTTKKWGDFRDENATGEYEHAIFKSGQDVITDNYGDLIYKALYHIKGENTPGAGDKAWKEPKRGLLSEDWTWNTKYGNESVKFFEPDENKQSHLDYNTKSGYEDNPARIRFHKVDKEQLVPAPKSFDKQPKNWVIRKKNRGNKGSDLIPGMRRKYDNMINHLHDKSGVGINELNNGLSDLGIDKKSFYRNVIYKPLDGMVTYKNALREAMKHK